MIIKSFGLLKICKNNFNITRAYILSVIVIPLNNVTSYTLDTACFFSLRGLLCLSDDISYKSYKCISLLLL